MKPSQSQRNLSPLSVPNRQLRARLIQRFHNLPIQSKHLLGVFSTKLLWLLGLTTLVSYPVINTGLDILSRQVQSELTVTEIIYHHKFKQVALNSHTISQDREITTLSQSYQQRKFINSKEKEEIEQILSEELARLDIDYTAVISQDFQTISSVNSADFASITPGKQIVNQILASSQTKQLTTSEVVATRDKKKLLVHYTLTPILKQPNQELLAWLVCGSVLKSQEIIDESLTALGNGYGAIYVHQTNGELTLLSSRKQVNLAQTEDSLITDFDLEEISLLNTALESQGKPVVAHLPLDSSRHTLVAKSLPHNPGEPVIIILRGREESLFSTLIGGLLYRQIVFFALALTAEIILAIWLTRLVIQPLRELQNKIKLFTRGILETRARVYQSDDIGLLATYFNQMADYICTSFVQFQLVIQEQKHVNEKLKTEIRNCQHIQKRLEKLNQCFLQFGSNTEENIRILVRVAGELLKADFAFYSYLEDNQTNTLVKWQSQSNCQDIEHLEGQICQQIMNGDDSELIILRHLHESESAKVDTTLVSYQVSTSIGMGIKCKEKVVGCLGIAYQTEVTPSQEDQNLINLIVSAIGVEEERKQAQRELNDNQERFALAVEGVNDGIWDWDLHTCQIYFSPRWKGILGYQDSELPNVFKSWIANIHPDDLPKFLNILHGYLEGRSSNYEVEFRAQHKDGSYRWLLARGAALRDKTGKPYRLAGSHTDITKRKQAEELLARRDRYLTALLEIQRQLLACAVDRRLYQAILSLLGSIANASRVYLVENHYDDLGRLLMSQKAEWCAPQIHRRCALELAQRNHQTCWQNLPYQKNFSRWAEVLAQGKCINGTVTQFPASEQEILEPQGILATLILPIIVKGDFFGFIGFDNCSQARAWEPSEISLLSSAATAISLAQERHISQEQEKLQLTAIEAATDGVAIIDPTGKFVYVNQAYLDIFGYHEPRELVGIAWQSLYELEEAQRLQKLIFSELRTTGQGRVEATAKRKDGSSFAQEFSLTLLEDRGLICVCRDISERKKSEAQLKANLSEKEVLIKEIHHRVKNNLYVISSLLNLQSSYIKDEQILNLFSDSQNRIQAMALIHEQLYQSKDLAQIDFAEYIQSLVNNLFNSYSSNYGQIKPVVKLESICLNLDTAIPCGLLINELVTNSFKHAFPEGKSGEIKIESRLNEDHCLHLIISDNGVGIPEDFDWENSPSLGLRLVRILSQQLDAKIECKSLSQGTSFNLQFSQLEYQERI